MIGLLMVGVGDVAASPRGRRALPPPLCPLGVSTYDFSRTRELIDRSHAATREWLDDDARNPDPRWALLPHRHH